MLVIGNDPKITRQTNLIASGTLNVHLLLLMLMVQ